MNEQRLGELLSEAPIPGEAEAQARSIALLSAAFAEREPGLPSRRRLALRPLLVLVLLAALLAAALSPPGRALVGSIRDAIGRERVVGRTPARQALVSLPARGRLLVGSSQGAWVVERDGSKRRLGDYEQTSWSPQGLFIVATQGRQLAALDPKGAVRWTLSRPEPLADARWSPSGFRIAYLAGRTLRVVAGDGTGDRLLVRAVAPIAPAWRPGKAHVLAYADRHGAVHVIDTDNNRELWMVEGGGGGARTLAWSADAKRLLVLSDHQLRLYDGGGQPLRTLELPPGRIALDAAFAPSRHHYAYTEYAPEGTAASSASSLFLADADADGPGRRLFHAAGRLDQLAWSPEGDWLLAAWPSADQWLFIRTPDVRKIVAVSNISREFNPGNPGAPSAPTLAGWCCP